MQKIEENNRIGKTRDLFKKIRDTKGTLHAKMGTIKDRNAMDLTEAEDIKNIKILRISMYTDTQKNCKKKICVCRIHRRTVQKRSSCPR